jgi:hypothetical protein
LPNYFVGFGLLFTFLGIVAALYFASSGVTGTIDKAQHALGDLLNAATFKFLASIARLVCSIAFSLLYRWRIRAIDRAFDQLCAQLERLMSFIAPEQLAAKQLRQAEHLPKGPNPRFVVTSLPAPAIDARSLHEDVYCARGEIENRIKEQQLDLFADRTSAATMRANQLRLWFASFAYVLLEALRRIGLSNDSALPAPAFARGPDEVGEAPRGTALGQALGLGCGQQMPTAEHVQRQVAVAVVIAVKEAALLMAVQRVIGGVEIEGDPLGRGLVRLEKEVDEQALDRRRIMPDLVVTVRPRRPLPPFADGLHHHDQRSK